MYRIKTGVSKANREKHGYGSRYRHSHTRLRNNSHNSRSFYIIYRRSKREALEDDFDPEFDGDAEFLPTNYVQMRPNPNSSSSAETTSQDMKEKFEQNFYASRGLGGGGMQMPAATPMAMTMQRGYSSNTLNTRSSLNPFGNSVTTAGLTDQAWEMDAIRLPEGNDSESLKNFARKLQTESVGGYHVASSSRNALRLSLGVATHEQTRNLCGPDFMVKEEYVGNIEFFVCVVDNNNNKRTIIITVRVSVTLIEVTLCYMKQT